MIFIGIGSNLSSNLYGKPLNNCLEAIKILKKKFTVNSISSWYESEPVPVSDQPWYINGVLSIKTHLSPTKILEILLDIEQNFGRVREKKNEARIIDLDLLSYNNITLNTQSLVIPHPRMHERVFVLKPLLDINPEWIHPELKLNVRLLLKKIKNKQNIKKLKN